MSQEQVDDLDKRFDDMMDEMEVDVKAKAKEYHKTGLRLLANVADLAELHNGWVREM